MRFLVILAALSLSTVAHGRRIGESDKTTSVGFRLGAYQPRIDSAFNLDGVEGPYERVFKNDDPFLYLLTLDRHIFNDAGTLTAGVGVGYWSVDGKGVSSSAVDSTSMRVVPVQAQVGYRLDFWEDIVPLVPAVRLGLDYYWWDIMDGSGETTRFPSGSEASGGTWGWHANFGVHLLLDFLDPEMATDFDTEAGVNSSYLVFELNYARVSDFGAGDSFRMGDTTFFVGIAFDL